MDALELSDLIKSGKVDLGDRVVLDHTEFGEHSGKAFEIIGFYQTVFTKELRPMILCEFGNIITEDRIKQWKVNNQYRMCGYIDGLENCRYWTVLPEHVGRIIPLSGDVELISGQDSGAKVSKDDGDRLLEFFSADVRRNEHGPSGLLFP